MAHDASPACATHCMRAQDASQLISGWLNVKAFFVRMLSMDDWLDHGLPEQ